MGDEEREPPSRPSRTATGRHRAVTGDELDIYQTHRRGVTEGAKAGEVRAKVAYLGQQLTMVERQADALAFAQADGNRRFQEVEKDVTALQAQLAAALKEQQLEVLATRSFIARVEGSMATMKWLIGIGIPIAVAAASAITYVVSHHP